MSWSRASSGAASVFPGNCRSKFFFASLMKLLSLTMPIHKQANPFKSRKNLEMVLLQEL